MCPNPQICNYFTVEVLVLPVKTFPEIRIFPLEVSLKQKISMKILDKFTFFHLKPKKIRSFVEIFPTSSTEINLSQHLGFSVRKHNGAEFVIIYVLCGFPLP